MTAFPLVRVAVALFALGVAPLGCASGPGSTPSARPAALERKPERDEASVPRAFRPYLGTRWIGDGVCYGPYRNGQRPGGPLPTRAELREDLRIIERRWNLLRLYGSAECADTILAVIRAERLDLRVVLGIWIDAEVRRDAQGQIHESRPEARVANRREVEAGVQLAAAYPDLVIGVSVGNESQVFWSGHRCPEEQLIGYLREVRSRVSQPVTTSDDRLFWNRPESRAIAREVDFLMLHLHPLWGGQQPDSALAWTKARFEEVRSLHPDRLIVLAETGWATKKHAVGEQATLIKGAPGENEQARFFVEVTAWTRAERIPLFFFSAFDENWKGGEHPDEVEKHWGLYRADRSPKQALAGAPAR